MTSEFTKHWSERGFTYEEALKKKTAVDLAHGVGTPKSAWNPAKVVKDTEKGGWKVVITTKS